MLESDLCDDSKRVLYGLVRTDEAIAIARSLFRRRAANAIRNGRGCCARVFLNEFGTESSIGWRWNYGKRRAMSSQVEPCLGHAEPCRAMPRSRAAAAAETAPTHSAVHENNESRRNDIIPSPQRSHIVAIAYGVAQAGRQAGTGTVGSCRRNSINT